MRNRESGIVRVGHVCPVWRAAACAAALLAAGTFGGCGPQEPAASGKLRVAASIFPLADLAREIGGPDVEVVTLLPPGLTPHDFQPTPEQVEQLSGCRLLLVVGLGLDPWAERCAAAAGRGIRVLRFAEAVAGSVIRVNEHPLGGAKANEPEHTAGDPHFWLDPMLLKAFIPQVQHALEQLDPDHKAQFAARAQAFGATLDALDAEYRDALAKTKRKAFVSFHSAFTYLAARYGLKQAAVLDANATESGPAAMERVVEFIKREKVQVIFAEPEFPPEKLRSIAEQTGASVGQIDPLDSPAAGGHRTYVDLMRTNLKILVDALNR